MDLVQIAESFSSHRFAEVLDRLSPTVRWVLPGQPTIDGKVAVAEACNATAADLAELARVDFVRFVSAAGVGVAAVDVIAHYIGHDGSTSVVSSADIYEFDGDGLIDMITSYAVELPV